MSPIVPFAEALPVLPTDPCVRVVVDGVVVDVATTLLVNTKVVIVSALVVVIHILSFFLVDVVTPSSVLQGLPGKVAPGLLLLLSLPRLVYYEAFFWQNGSGVKLTQFDVYISCGCRYPPNVLQDLSGQVA